MKITDKIYIDLDEEPTDARVLEKLTYPNPEYYAKMNMGISVYKIPQQIKTYEIKGRQLQIYRGEALRIKEYIGGHKYGFDHPNHPISLRYANKDFDLDEYQERAIEAIKGTRQGVVHAVTSAGKSLIILKAICELGQRALIIVHRKVLMQQLLEDIEKYVRDEKGEKIKAGIIGGGKFEINDITIGIDKSIANNISSCEKEFGVVILDECFVGNTKISTPTGDKDIKDIKVGDEVINNTGVGIVEAISIKHSDELCLMKYNHRHIFCTPNHPIATTKGWCEAGHIKPNDILFKYAKSTNKKKMSILQRIIQRTTAFIVLQTRSFLQMDVDPSKEKQSYVQAGMPGQSISYTKRNGTSTSSSRREWETKAVAGKDIIRSAWEGMGEWLQCKNWICSVLVRDRHSSSKKDDSNRNRRKISLSSIEASAGPKEGKNFVGVGVDSIEILKQGSNRWAKNGFKRSEKVYNLQVSGDPSYIANGILVHNCHIAPTNTISQIINSINAKYRFGFSGTLRRKDQKEFLIFATFGQVIATIEKEELLEKGRVVPVRCECIDSETRFDWDSACEDLGPTKARHLQEKTIALDPTRNKMILDKVSKLEGKTIVLSRYVDPCYRLQEALREDYGMESGVITGKNAKEAIASYNKMKHSDLKVIFATIGCVSTGVSISDLDNIVLISPIFTNELLIHQIRGRLMRTSEGKDHGTLYYIYDQYIFPYWKLKKFLSIVNS